MKEEHWDPQDHEKVYYRHNRTGDLGWMVRREGKDCIRLDRPAQEIVKVFRPDEWDQDHQHRALTKLQLCQIAFEADKKLCFFLGKHLEARSEWLSLPEQARIMWAKNGPPNESGRGELFRAVMKALERHAGR